MDTETGLLSQNQNNANTSRTLCTLSTCTVLLSNDANCYCRALQIDTLLAEAGSSKSNIIEARIWIKHIGRDFKDMNAVWNAWVDPQSKGTRFCVEASGSTICSHTHMCSIATLLVA